VSPRYGVVADVHANLPALEAVLAELRRREPDELVVAGDLVGYGPNPNECVALLAELGAQAVAGNHDLIVLGRLGDDRCIGLARETLRWTRGVLAPSARAHLADLPPRLELPGGVAVAHGSLDDPQEYVTRPHAAAAQLRALARAAPQAWALVLGHTHRPLAFAAEGGRLATRGRVRLPSGAVLLNPGAAGQSRDRRALARAMVLDTERRAAEFLAVPYDEERCRAELRAHGLPERAHHLRPSLGRAAYRSLRDRLPARSTRARTRG